MPISYPIAAPASPRPSAFDLEFQPNIAFSRSPFSGAVKTYEFDGIVWRAAITLPPLANATQAREWHGFLAALNGMSGTFTMAPIQHATPSGTQAANIAVRTAALIRAKEVAVKGMTAGATLLRGDMISIASRLYQVVETATANGSGQASLTLSHGLRAAAAVDDTITLLNPVGTWRLSNNAALRQIVVGGVSNISFAVEEAL